MSVHTWGEAPHGNWQLEIHNEGRYMGKCACVRVYYAGTARVPIEILTDVQKKNGIHSKKKKNLVTN